MRGSECCDDKQGNEQAYFPRALNHSFPFRELCLTAARVGANATKTPHDGESRMPQSRSSITVAEASFPASVYDPGQPRPDRHPPVVDFESTLLLRTIKVECRAVVASRRAKTPPLWASPSAAFPHSSAAA